MVEFLTKHKTTFIGLGAIISGIFTMATAADSTQSSAGWTQVLAGVAMIFLNRDVKNTENKVVQNTVKQNQLMGIMQQNSESVSRAIEENTNLTANVNKALQYNTSVTENVGKALEHNTAITQNVDKTVARAVTLTEATQKEVKELKKDLNGS